MSKEKKHMRKPAQPGVDRRQQILEAALDVFAEEGFEAATTKEIATRVGVAQGLVYFYFSSKVDLLLAALEHQGRLSIEQLDTGKEGEKSLSPEDALHAMFVRFIQVLEADRTAKLLKVVARTELPSKQVGREQFQQDHKQQINLLGKQICLEISDSLKQRLPIDQFKEEIEIESNFFAGAIISLAIRRILHDEYLSGLPQEQAARLLSDNLKGWIAIKKQDVPG
jgi:AcrR family transcriptional regulator